MKGGVERSDRRKGGVEVVVVMEEKVKSIGRYGDGGAGGIRESYGGRGVGGIRG